MAYNNRGGNRGGKRFSGGQGGGYGGGGYSGHRGNRAPMQMHQAVCAECGNSCEVPFRPSGDKPVFCNSCFKGKKGDSSGSRSDSRGGRDFERRDSRGGRRSYGDRDYSDRPPVEMHEAVCSDCGKECEVPFKPSGDKPIYCDKCFGRNKEVKSARPSHGGNDKLDEKLTMINIKLDRILKALDATASTKDNQRATEQHSAKENKPSSKKTPIIKGIEIVKPEKSVIKKAKTKAKKNKAVKIAKK